MERQQTTDRLIKGIERCQQIGRTAAMQQQFRSPEEAAHHYNDLRLEYILRCEPYIRVMIDLRNLQSVRYQVSEQGGLVEVEVMWRENDKQLYDMCQEMIDLIRQQYTTKGGINYAAGTNRQEDDQGAVRL